MATIYSDTIREEIIRELKLEGFTEDEKNEIVDFIEENCVLQVHLDILAALPEEDKDEFFKVCERTNPERIQAFLMEKLPNFKEIVQNASAKVVQEFVKLQS